MSLSIELRELEQIICIEILLVAFFVDYHSLLEKISFLPVLKIKKLK